MGDEWMEKYIAQIDTRLAHLETEVAALRVLFEGRLTRLEVRSAFFGGGAGLLVGALISYVLAR